MHTCILTLRSFPAILQASKSRKNPSISDERILMRSFTAFLPLMALAALEAAAHADRIQLPCDGDVAVTFGTDSASARTDVSGYGISFTRFTPFSLDLEASLLDACRVRKAG